MTSRKYHHRPHRSLIPRRIRSPRTDSRFSSSSWSTETQTPRSKYVSYTTQRTRPLPTDSHFSSSSWSTEKQTQKPKYARYTTQRIRPPRTDSRYSPSPESTETQTPTPNYDSYTTTQRTRPPRTDSRYSPSPGSTETQTPTPNYDSYTTTQRMRPPRNNSRFSPTTPWATKTTKIPRLKYASHTTQKARPPRTNSRFSRTVWPTQTQFPRRKFAASHRAPRNYSDDDDDDDVPAYVIDDSIPTRISRGILPRRSTTRNNDIIDRYEDVDNRYNQIVVRDKPPRGRTVRFVDDVDYGGTDDDDDGYGETDYGGTDRVNRSVGSPADDTISVAYSSVDSVDSEVKEDDEDIHQHKKIQSKEDDGADNVADQRRTTITARRQPRKQPKDDSVTRNDRHKLREFEQALDEAVADDDQFLKMVRENRTRLARDTEDWTHEYSLDNEKISYMAQKLIKGDLRHLYADLPPHQRTAVEEAVSRMREMSLQELMDSIAAVD